MNLLTKKIKEPKENIFTVSTFRKAQYKLLEYFITLGIEYISKQNKNYLNIKKITIQDILTYNSIHNSSLTQVDCYVSFGNVNNVETKLFVKFLLPTLVEDCFFVLNGNLFVPTLYILDRPIIIKENSIKLSSTFNSITIYDKLITFMGNNIPAMYFLDLLLSDHNQDQAELKKDLINHFNFKKGVNTLTEKDLLSYFANLFKCDENKQTIQDRFNNIFFDDYTKLLYQQCYNLTEKQFTIAHLLKLSLNIANTSQESDFINLDQKRLIFIEILLLPLFKRIAVIASQASRGFSVNSITMDQMELIKNFHINLHNKFIYDNVNPFDNMLKFKACMLNPNVEQAPGIIAHLHETHYKKLCPISVSSQKPGETLYIVPDTEIDIFGRFL
ncbi:MAG: hypothetical protein WC188_03935 [Candidatus Caldatribacteriota bacterium]|nr:hypothetical protein [Patescibacteria group bacterium]